MNVLWICTDQQRFDTLGCMGNPWVYTPNLDRLAAEGVLFENTYAQSPVCAPSRGCFYPVDIRVPADRVRTGRISVRTKSSCRRCLPITVITAGCLASCICPRVIRTLGG